MALIHAIRRITPSTNTADGTGPEGVDADRDGNLFMGPDWVQRAIARGLGGRVTVGAFSTPVPGGGATSVISQVRPRVSISVASGFLLNILSINVQCQVPLLAADLDEAEILVALDRAAAQDGSGTATATTVFNMRTDLGSAGPAGVTVRSVYTSDATNPTLSIELARAVVVGDVQGTAANAMWTPLRLDYEPKYLDYIAGPACVYVYWGGTAATPGFAQATFVCRPAGYVG